MPGTKGKKLIQRKSVSGKFFSIKSLVFSLLTTKPLITKDAVEKIVMKEYPQSNFVRANGKGGHFSWYKHRFTREKLEEEFTRIKESSSREKTTTIQKVEPTKPKPDSADTSPPPSTDSGRAVAKPSRSRRVRA